MSQRDPAKWDRKRGRHKKRASREGQDWNNWYLPLAPVARPAPPPKPPRGHPLILVKPYWMDDETFAKLRDLAEAVR